jgi:hypothetical protein
MSSNYVRCKICDEYGWENSHVCNPLWNAVLYEYNDDTNPDDWYEARGNDPEEAALYLADRHFSDWDFPDQMEIWVKKPEDTEWVKFDISVQAVPEFTANQKVAA